MINDTDKSSHVFVPSNSTVLFIVLIFVILIVGVLTAKKCFLKLMELIIKIINIILL